MKRILLIMVVLTFVLSAGAFARSLGLPNELINGSFEALNLVGWSVEGRMDGWDFPAPYGSLPHVARNVKGYYSGAIADGRLYQDVYVDPGTYEIDMSGYVKRYVLDSNFAMHPDWGWSRAELIVDGNVVATSPNYPANDVMNYFELRWTGPVESYKRVAIVWGTLNPGAYKTFDVMVCDDIDLEERIVPEPCSMLALIGGLAGLVIRRRK